MTEPLPTDAALSARRTTNVLLTCLAVIAMLASLKAAQLVVLPVLLAFFLAILLKPILSFLSRFMPYVASLGVALSGMVGIGILLWLFVSTSVASVAERGPAYVERIQALIEIGVTWAKEYGFDISNEAMVGNEEIFKFGVQFVGASIVPILSSLALGALVAFMLILLLLEARTFHTKLVRGMDGASSRAFFETLDSVMTKFQTYFFTKTLISLATGVCTGLYTWALGIDFPFIWGTLAFLLNFIPNIGSMMAVVPPTLLAFLQFHGIAHAAITLSGLTAIQLFIGNFLDPRIVGRSVSLSPFVVFVSMVFWGWMWGIVGIFLAVPLTVGLRIVFSHVEPMRPLAVLMEGTDPADLVELNSGPAEAIAIPPPTTDIAVQGAE
jgi:predicted PurR-regulated permease PerM